jgi:hypothetical protein
MLTGDSGGETTHLARCQAPLKRMLKKTRDHWWDGYSLALTNGVIVGNSPPASEGDGLAAELKN